MSDQSQFTVFSVSSWVNGPRNYDCLGFPDYLRIFKVTEMTKKLRLKFWSNWPCDWIIAMTYRIALSWHMHKSILWKRGSNNSWPGMFLFFTNSLIMWQQIINKNGGVSIWRSLVQYYYFGGGFYVIVYGISNSFNGRGKWSRRLIFKILKLWIEVHLTCLSWGGGVQDTITKIVAEWAYPI